MEVQLLNVDWFFFVDPGRILMITLFLF